MTISTPPDLPVPPTPESRAADVLADEALQRHAHRLVMCRKHKLLENLLDRWYADAPVAVLAWLRRQPGVEDGGVTHG